MEKRVKYASNVEVETMMDEEGRRRTSVQHREDDAGSQVVLSNDEAGKKSRLPDALFYIVFFFFFTLNSPLLKYNTCKNDSVLFSIVLSARVCSSSVPSSPY